MREQTTAERIRGVIRRAIADAPFIMVGANRAAETIAAEIDALTEQNAFLLASAEAAQANLAACRAELAEARAYISTIIGAPGEVGR